MLVLIKMTDHDELAQAQLSKVKLTEAKLAKCNARRPWVTKKPCCVQGFLKRRQRGLVVADVFDKLLLQDHIAR